MPHPRFTNEEIARRGEEIYAARLRDILEQEHRGEVVIINVESGEYEIGPDSLVANRRALAKDPGAVLSGQDCLTNIQVGYCGCLQYNL